MNYCMHCGRPITDGCVCEECIRRIESGRKPIKRGRKYGLGFAVPSAVCGVGGAVMLGVSVVTMIVYIFVLTANAVVGNDVEQYGGQLAGAVACFIIGTVMCVAAVVLGIISVRKFISTRGCPARPVATVVLGVIGIVFGAICIILIGVFVVCAAAGGGS